MAQSTLFNSLIGKARSCNFQGYFHSWQNSLPFSFREFCCAIFFVQLLQNSVCHFLFGRQGNKELSRAVRGIRGEGREQLHPPMHDTTGDGDDEYGDNA